MYFSVLRSCCWRKRSQSYSSQTFSGSSGSALGVVRCLALRCGFCQEVKCTSPNRQPPTQIRKRSQSYSSQTFSGSSGSAIGVVRCLAWRCGFCKEFNCTSRNCQQPLPQKFLNFFESKPQPDCIRPHEHDEL